MICDAFHQAVIGITWFWLGRAECSFRPSRYGLRPLDITNFSGHFTHTADVNANNIQRTIEFVSAKGTDSE